ncbi:MAG: putative bifunctional diguanylate cyclase/phosphodiesterase [Acidimicrobiales bacterium]|nr:EAL domain-containing protein [Actinomycetota bacterium]
MAPEGSSFGTAPTRAGADFGDQAPAASVNPATAEPDRSEPDLLNAFRLRSVKVGLGASVLIICLIVIYSLLPGHVPLDVPAFYTLIGIAAAGTVVVALVPWEHLSAVHGASYLLHLYTAWAVLNIALVSAGVAVTGGHRSDLYLVDLALCVFLAGASYPRPYRAALTLMMLLGYAAALLASGWGIPASSLVFRLGMIVATALSADFLADEFTGEIRFHQSVMVESERRAALWSRVADLGKELDVLDPNLVLAHAVEAVAELGFEAANVALFDDDRQTYKVIHPIGIPPEYSEALHPATMGMPGLVLREQGMVIVDEYASLPGGVPVMQAEGITTAVGAPLRVEGGIAAVLVGAARERREVNPEVLAAFELVASHASHALETARDVERHRRDASRFRSLLESAPDAMIVLDSSGRIVEANDEAERIFGYAPDTLTGSNITALLPERQRHLAAHYQEAFASDPHNLKVGVDDEVFAVRADGSEFLVEALLGSIDTPDGTLVTVAVRDVTERRELERHLAHQATHDHLTGLPNRAQFVDRLNASMASDGAVGLTATVCFLDVDHFKYVNDSRGHGIGDRLLMEIARRLAGAIGPGDHLARFGGDEFAILASHVQDRAGALAYAWHLLSIFDEPFELDDVECYVSASIGVAFGRVGYAPHDVLREADTAMYHAKQSGRARVELFDEALTGRAAERLALESDLHRAIDGSELYLVYQPVVSIETHEVVGMEALIRWQHPERGLVPPLAFIPVAEDTGLILPIGRFVLEEACRQLAEWRSRIAEFPDISMSVNVSSRQLEHDRLVADVGAILEDTGVPPELLVLEITESFFIRDLPAAVRRLNALKRLGLRISLDDFGTGFSSLSSLSRLPIDIVKIDKSFIDGLGTKYDAVVSAVIEVARAFDLQVVAEGIEHPQQLAHLRQIGCGYAQGYYFAKPLTVDALELFVMTPPLQRDPAAKSDPSSPGTAASLQPAGRDLS